MMDPVAPCSSSRRQIGQHLLLAMGGMLTLLPFVWMIVTSGKSLDEVNRGVLLPETWQWRNYRDVFAAIPFVRFYWNSLFVATWVTVLQLMTSALAAFAFARLEWRLRDWIFPAYLATLMLPSIVLIIPNFQNVVRLGWVDSYPGLILPAAFSAFGTFLLRQFMLSIPRELDEAAAIDGASSWRLFWDIILPLSRPSLVVLAIFSFLGNYHSFFWPLVIQRTPEHFTLPVGLLYFDTERGQATHLMMAAISMSVVPLIILFVFAQRHVLRGIQLGGAVKG